MMRGMTRAALLIVSVALWGGCSTSTGYDYPADLASKNYIKRTKAAQEFAQRKDESHAHQAFSLLNDELITLRALAHMTLRDLSDGEDFGYRSDLESADRWRVARRWQFWWETRHVSSENGRG